MSDQTRTRQQASIAHPFLTVFIPFWFMLTVVNVMINSAILQSGSRVFPPFYIVLLLLVGVSEIVTGNLLYKERIAGILPRLREFVFIVIFGLLFILLFHGDLMRGNFNIGRLKIWLPMLILAVEWFMCYYVHQKLRERELFLKFFEGKPDKEVREIYDSYMHEGGESLKAIKSLKRFVIVLTVIGFLMLNVMTWGYRFNFRGMNLLIILIFFGGNLLIASVLNTWGEVQFIMMDGLLVSKGQRRFRVAVIVLLFIVVFVLAIPATGSRPLLPESYIAAFFEWLQNVGRFDPPDTEIEPPELQFGEQDYDTGDYLGNATASLGDQDRTLANITRIIGYVLLVALGIGAILFLVIPLFRRGADGAGGIKSAFKQLSDNIRRAIEQMKSSFSQMLETIRNRRKSRIWKKKRDRGGQGWLQQTIERASGRMGLSRKERRVNNKVLKAFFRFTKWGEKRGVPFQTTMGAWEYAIKLEEQIPELAAECNEVAGMFEEVMYSNHDIQESFRSAFYDKIKDVVKTK